MVHEKRLSIRETRELIGVVRTLYLSWQAQGVAPRRLDELVAVGRELRDALELASSGKPDELVYRKASHRIEHAVAGLRSLVEDGERTPEPS